MKEYASHKSILNSGRFAAVVFLAACSGGGSSGGEQAERACAPITGGASEFTTTCTGCSVSTAGSAVDRDLSTSADVTSDALSTSYTTTVRATAQSGVVFPGGSNPGVFLTSESACGYCNVTLSTYLDGTLQETKSGTNNTTLSGYSAERAVILNTTLPFDAVEVGDSGAVTPNNAGRELRVFELCSDVQL